MSIEDKLRKLFIHEKDIFEFIENRINHNSFLEPYMISPVIEAINLFNIDIDAISKLVSKKSLNDMRMYEKDLQTVGTEDEMWIYTLQELNDWQSPFNLDEKRFMQKTGYELIKFDYIRQMMNKYLDVRFKQITFENKYFVEKNFLMTLHAHNILLAKDFELRQFQIRKFTKLALDNYENYLSEMPDRYDLLTTWEEQCAEYDTYWAHRRNLITIRQQLYGMVFGDDG